MSDRVEIVTTDAGHHVRVVASNGEPIATTEVHPDRRDAENAVIVMGRVFGVKVRMLEDDQWFTYTERSNFDVDITYVDERD